jgi:signal peptidase I
VSCVDGDLYINGEIIEEPYLDTEYAKNNAQPFTKDFGPVTLGEDEYFCMGDNRPHSTDSRYYGPFKRDKIISKGIMILYPLNQFGPRNW